MAKFIMERRREKLKLGKCHIILTVKILNHVVPAGLLIESFKNMLIKIRFNFLEFYLTHLRQFLAFF